MPPKKQTFPPYHGYHARRIARQAAWRQGAEQRALEAELEAALGKYMAAEAALFGAEPVGQRRTARHTPGGPLPLLGSLH